MGHIRAAEALGKAIKEVNPDLEVQTCDPMATTSSKLQQFFNQAYLFLGNYLPPLWGFFYNSRILSSNYNPFKWNVRRKYGQSIKLAIDQFNPDLLVSTHPFIADAAGQLKKKGIINLPLISVVTDYHVHPWGINKYIDLFILPSEDVQIKGIPEGKIKISGGLATDPKFFKPQDKDSLVKTFGIAKDHKVVLILCGGFGMGMGGVIKLLQGFKGIDFPLQLLVVVGKNEELKTRLTQIAQQLKIKTTIFGFVENMEELMSVCDLVVTKPGGTSISEALTKGLPLILTDPIPGQEDWNVQILLKERIAIQPENLTAIPGLIIKLFTSEADRLQEMRQRIKEKFADTRSVYNIANEIINYR